MCGQGRHVRVETLGHRFWVQCPFQSKPIRVCHIHTIYISLPNPSGRLQGCPINGQRNHVTRVPHKWEVTHLPHPLHSICPCPHLCAPVMQSTHLPWTHHNLQW